MHHCWTFGRKTHACQTTATLVMAVWKTCYLHTYFLFPWNWSTTWVIEHEKDEILLYIVQIRLYPHSQICHICIYLHFNICFNFPEDSLDVSHFTYTSHFSFWSSWICSLIPIIYLVWPILWGSPSSNEWKLDYVGSTSVSVGIWVSRFEILWHW